MAFSQSRVLKVPGTMAFRPVSFGHDASAFGAPAEPGVENTRQKNGRPADGKCASGTPAEPGTESTRQ